MKYKSLWLTVITVTVLFSFTTSFALQFAIENFSGFATLSYDYSFDNKHWTWCAFLPGVTQNPQSFVNLNFANQIPISWRLEGTMGNKLQCVDYKTRQPTASIITLKDRALQTKDMLLLDVLVLDSQQNAFTAQIIDLDGEIEYSNIIECRYK